MDFEVGGIKYRSARMDARAQFHLTRKLAPLFANIGAVTNALSGDGAPDGPKQGFNFSALAPLADAIAALPDDEADYILDKCLAVVSRESGAGYAPVFGGKRMMFDDIGMVEMIQIAMAVIQDSLSNFTNALSSGLTVSVAPGANLSR